MDFLILSFKLLFGHALADFVFQNDAMATGKNRWSTLRDKMGPHFPPWYYWLTAHAFVHGGTVLLITNNFFFAVFETIVHWMIDYAKCAKKINFHHDQFLHILCKMAYVTALYLELF